MEKGFEFLGFHVHMRWDRRYGYCPRIEIPKAKAKDLRFKVKRMTARNTTPRSLGQALQDLNPIPRGWANYYRYCAGAHRVFTGIDWYTNDRLWRWMRRKRRKVRKLWRDGHHEQYMLAWTSTCRYRLAWIRMPDFDMPFGISCLIRARSMLLFTRRQDS
jgi:hypothetical protein